MDTWVFVGFSNSIKKHTLSFDFLDFVESNLLLDFISFVFILFIRGGNSCRWIIFVSYQYMNHINIRQPKPDTNNKRVNIR